MVFTKTLASTVATTSAYLTSVLLAPLMLSRLGLEAFGVWAVTGAIAQYAALLDLGVTRALSRYVAIYHAKDDERAIAECVGLGLVMVSAVVLMSGTAAILAAPLLADALGVLDADDMRTVMICSVAIFAFHSYRAVIGSIANGMQAFVPPAIAAVIGNVNNLVVSAVVLFVSPNLVDFAIWSAIAAATNLIPSLSAMLYVWRRPRVALPGGPRARELFGFGMKNQLHFVADMVSNQSGKLVVALVIDARAAAIYELASRSVGVVKTFAFMSSRALGPVGARRITLEGREFLQGFFLRYTRMTLALSVPLFMVTCLTAPFLLVAWLGDIPGETAALVIILCLGFLPSLVREMGIVCAMADGNANLIAANAVVWAVSHLVLMAVLTPLLGLWGAVLATSLGVTISSVTYLRRFLRIYDVPATAFWSAVRTPMALAVGLAVVLAPVTLLGLGLADDRATAFPALVVVGVLYLVAYWVPSSRLGLLPEKLTLRAAGVSRWRRKTSTT